MRSHLKPSPGSVVLYSLELISVERDGRTIYRLRMRWKTSAGTWRGYRKTWKYKVIQNAMNKLVALVARYGQPKKVSIFGYDSNVTEIGLRPSSGPAEPR